MARYRPRHLGPRVRAGTRRRAAALAATLTLAAIGVGGVVAAIALDDRDGATGTEVAAGAASTTTVASSTTTSTAPPRRATLVFGGDVLIHSGVWEAAARDDGSHDFSPMLAPLSDRLRAADLALCHLEVTLAAEGESLSSYPRFRAPAALTTDLAEAGFDGCSVSSNHALDFGAGGVRATLDALDAAGLGHAGTARTRREDRRPVVYDAGGIRVGHLSYAYGFNGFTPPADAPWVVDPIDVERIAADARALRAAGAELVVTSLHWGAEYRHDPTDAQQQVATALAATRTVDLVIGHHAHVVQPITRVGGMWVVYGLGNMLSNNSPGTGRHDDVVDGLVVTVTVGDRRARPEVGVLGLRVTPTWNERDGFRVLPVADALADPASSPELLADLRASWDRTMATVLGLDGPALGVRADRAPPR